jgi:hypothetical protein
VLELSTRTSQRHSHARPLDAKTLVSFLWTIYSLYCGKTTNGTKHLEDAYGVSSETTKTEVSRKRTLDEAESAAPSSRCMRRRSERSWLLLDKRLKGARSVTIVADFWTCKTQHDKYLGVRAKWKLSVLLGIRMFHPSCAKQAKGFRGAFRPWTTKLMGDFDLQNSDVFAGMIGGASDVKGLMVDDTKARWEWCTPYIMNAPTKWACSTTETATSKNLEGADLIEIRQVRDVEKMGTPFEALCQLEGISTSVRLVDYHMYVAMSTHRELVSPDTFFLIA